MSEAQTGGCNTSKSVLLSVFLQKARKASSSCECTFVESAVRISRVGRSGTPRISSFALEEKRSSVGHCSSGPHVIPGTGEECRFQMSRRSEQRKLLEPTRPGSSSQMQRHDEQACGKMQTMRRAFGALLGLAQSLSRTISLRSCRGGGFSSAASPPEAEDERATRTGPSWTSDNLHNSFSAGKVLQEPVPALSQLEVVHSSAGARTTSSHFGYPAPGAQCPTPSEVSESKYFLPSAEWERLRKSGTFDYIVVGSGLTALAFVDKVCERVLCNFLTANMKLQSSLQAGKLLMFLRSGRAHAQYVCNTQQLQGLAYVMMHVTVLFQTSSRHLRAPEPLDSSQWPKLLILLN